MRKINRLCLFGGHRDLTGLQLLPCQSAIFRVSSDAEMHSVVLQGLKIAPCHGSQGPCIRVPECAVKTSRKNPFLVISGQNCKNNNRIQLYRGLLCSYKLKENANGPK